jgi:hypothetical protein
LPPSDQKLNYQAAPNYGEANLSAAFSPDPYSVGMTTGGPVNVGYLGSSCSGFATSKPDLKVNFGGSGASLLRIYFVSTSADAAFVVNDPYRTSTASTTPSGPSIRRSTSTTRLVAPTTFGWRATPPTQL